MKICREELDSRRWGRGVGGLEQDGGEGFIHLGLSVVATSYGVALGVTGPAVVKTVFVAGQF